jgi:hypothetical protein
VVLFALMMAVLFLPLWVQLILFFIALWVIPIRLALFLPAILSDALYGTGALSPHAFMFTAVVAVLLVLRWLLITQTRFASMVYGVEA